MKYRDFGSTGKKISQVGFGCMRLPEIDRAGKRIVDNEKAIPMLRRGFELGINYFDTAVGYCNGLSQHTVGLAVKPFRDKIMISTKLPLDMVNHPDDFKKVLNQSLERLDTGYIDFYHFHGINKNAFDDKIIFFKLMDQARKAIDEKLIRHISFSFHDNANNLKYIVDRGEIFSSVLLQYNLLDRSNENAISYAAEEKKMGIVVMGPVAGGRLAAPSNLNKKLLDLESNSTPELALRFVLGNKNVSCALSGMTNIEMLEQNCLVGDDENPMTEADWNQSKIMMEEIKKFDELYCTGCAYCMPCPKGIDIPHIFNCYTYFNVYGLKDHAKNMFARVGREQRGSGKAIEECINCGKCAEKCPQKIDIPNKIKEVQEIILGSK